MTSQNIYSGKIGFCVGTGRCGTTLLAELAKHEPEVAAHHERQRLAATFHLYCQWNRIPVDHAGFLLAKEDAVREDFATHRFSLKAARFYRIL